MKAAMLKKLKVAYWRRRTIRQNVTVGDRFVFGTDSVVWAPRSLDIGNNVSLGSNVRIEVDGKIGDDVLIANGVGIVGREDHDMGQVGVSIRDSRWVGRHADDMSHETIVGSDVWIGYAATVLSGVTIGDSSIVGAGSVVTKDIPANSIAVGNPARVIGARFDQESFTRHWAALHQAGIARMTP
ncbi:acyltransferase [Cryobacterium tagatosivorans]|nr:acyltransferase [Cryobacterium tagatosivorans]